MSSLFHTTLPFATHNVILPMTSIINRRMKSNFFAVQQFCWQKLVNTKTTTNNNNRTIVPKPHPVLQLPSLEVFPALVQTLMPSPFVPQFSIGFVQHYNYTMIMLIMMPQQLPIVLYCCLELKKQIWKKNNNNVQIRKGRIKHSLNINWFLLNNFSVTSQK